MKADVILLEYIPGQTIHAWRSAEIHTWNQDWFRDISQAVKDMHAAGISHFDLNGYNIIVVPEDIQLYSKFVIVDFGAARDYAVSAVELSNAVSGFMCCRAHGLTLWKWCCEDNSVDSMWFESWELMKY
ncbi:hypothetical protein PENSPDRAFT_680328 [Peniophora sp. CONT]|nr:hypothetical protein PENSPDRAFT_680328 [Peniophora sp. CONT]